MSIWKFVLCVPNSFTQLTKCKVLFLNDNIGHVHENFKEEILNKVCGPYLVDLLNLAHIYEWCMVRLVHSQEWTPKKTCVMMRLDIISKKKHNTFWEDLCVCSNRKRIFTTS